MFVNAPPGSPVCPQCGAAAGSTAGRCIHCGFLFTEATPPVIASIGFVRGRMRPRARPPQTNKGFLMILAGGVLFVGVTATLAWTTLRGNVDEPIPASSARPALTTAPQAPSASRLEPNTLLAKAKSRALTWHRDALLVEIDAAPVARDGSIANSGSVLFAFGKPAGARVGAGAEVLPSALQVSYGEGGTQVLEKPGRRSRAVAEPNCLVEDVAKAVASSVPSAGALHLRYAMDERHGRAVWLVSEVGEANVLRTLDGVSCNILTEK